MLDEYQIPSEEDLLLDPAVSYWLKNQIEICKTRDIVDAIKDAELLLGLLKSRFEVITGNSRKDSRSPSDDQLNELWELISEYNDSPNRCSGNLAVARRLVRNGRQ